MLAFLLRMTVYRYSPESIDTLSRRAQRHHSVALAIFVAAVCSAEFAPMAPGSASIFAVVFALATAVVCAGTRRSSRKRIANWFASTVVEIDDEKAACRSSLGKSVIYRSELTEACFSPQGIWLQGRRRRARLHFPPEFQDFEKLAAFLQEWLPEDVVRRSSPPSSLLAYSRAYGQWILSAVLFYVAFSAQTRWIAIPACILAAAGSAWYFAWCGRKIGERRWRVALPVCGYFLALALLLRAIALWITR